MPDDLNDGEGGDSDDDSDDKDDGQCFGWDPTIYSTFHFVVTSSPSGPTTSSTDHSKRVNMIFAQRHQTWDVGSRSSRCEYTMTNISCR